MSQSKKIVNRIQSWAPDKLKAAPRAVFKFLTPNSATTVPAKYTHYRPARLVKTKARWYIEYWYRVPAEFANEHPGKEFVRFRVFEDINRYKSDEYAQELLAAVNLKLDSGFNPWETRGAVQSADWSLNYALEKFMLYSTEKGLRTKTLQTYNIAVGFLKEYFLPGNVLYKPLEYFTREVVAKMLNDLKRDKGWNNTTYNNYLSLMATIFNWFVREGKLVKSPTAGLEQKKAPVTTHRYYSDEQAKQLKDRMKATNPHLYNFCEFIYYTGTRPKSEARLLQVKHILFDRKLLFVPGSISKNKKDDYIPMAPELIDMLRPLEGRDPATYLWGTKGPANKPASQNHFATLYKPFKDALGLDESYTIYGWKHSRAIHLANAGVDPYAIMKLFRHSGLDVTMKYLRELGCDVDWNKYNIDQKF